MIHGTNENHYRLMRRSRIRKYLSAFLVIILVSIVGAPLNCYGTYGFYCDAQGTSLLILTSSRRMILCQENRYVKEYRISLGRGGIDKKKQGDNKTPLGRYALGAPRPSNRFGTFIPIGYPSREQQLMGYSGGDVGIHGPVRFFKWLGPINTWFNWTQGCIAVGRDSELSELVEWIKSQNVTKVSIQ